MDPVSVAARACDQNNTVQTPTVLDVPTQLCSRVRVGTFSHLRNKTLSILQMENTSVGQPQQHNEAGMGPEYYRYNDRSTTSKHGSYCIAYYPKITLTVSTARYEAGLHYYRSARPIVPFRSIVPTAYIDCALYIVRYRAR